MAEAGAIYGDLEQWTRALGAEHPATLMAMTHLAAVCKEQGLYPEAEKLLFESLEISERVLGADHPALGSSHYHLACLSSALGQPAEAIAHLREAVGLGYGESLLATDPALDPLCGTPEFETLAKEAEARLEASKESAWNGVG